MGNSGRQRAERILVQAYEKGRVTIKDLATEMAVSEATVRRDLKMLTGDGLLERVYGGAAVLKSHDYSFRGKFMRHAEAKRTIGRLAAELVSDGEQIFLDSGTTSFQMGLCLKGRRGLSIIANSARLALELDSPGLSVIMLGGQYRPDRMDTVGPMATNSLDLLRGFIAFVGADGLSMEFGPAASDIESAHLYGQAVRHSREAVLLVDHSKFLSPSLFKITDFETISRVVTDRRPGAEWMEFFEARRIGVIHPPVEPVRQGRQPDDPTQP